MRMLRTVLAALAATALLAGQPPAKKESLPAGLPANAKQIDDVSWRAVDAKGKAWIYRKTPFGLVKTADDSKPGAPAAAANIPPNMKVKEEGEQLRFTRPGPFGMYTWVKKKTDVLNDDEKAVWELEQQSRTGKKE